MFFGGNSNCPVGIDISDLSLKIAQLDKTGNKIKIKALGRIDLPEGIIKNGEILNKEEAIKNLKKLLDNPEYGKVTSSRVVACLPETKTFVKLIKVTSGPNDISEIIETEIQKHVPHLIEDIYYDWQIMEDKGESQLVLIGAAPKKVVNQYTDFFHEAKMSVEALEIEPLVICRSILDEESPEFKGEEKKNYMILDIGAARTSVSVYSHNTLLFTSSVAISGEEVTRNIEETLKINHEQAEKAKILCGLDDKKCDGVIKDIMADKINDLSERIEDILEFYDNHFPKKGPIDKVYFCGGGANIEGLGGILKEVTKTEAERANSLHHINSLDDKNKESFFKKINNFDFLKRNRKKRSIFNKNTSLTFATAIGLALRGIFVDDL